MAIVKKESVDTVHSGDEVFQPVDLEKLSKMAANFPKDYASKLEVHLM